MSSHLLLAWVGILEMSNSRLEPHVRNSIYLLDMGDVILKSSHSLSVSGYTLPVGAYETFALGILYAKSDGLIGLQHFMHIYIMFAKPLGYWIVVPMIVVV